MSYGDRADLDPAKAGLTLLNVMERKKLNLVFRTI